MAQEINQNDNAEVSEQNAPAIMLQMISDQAQQTALGSYAMQAQLACQTFCEKKAINDAQDLVDANT